MLAVCAQHGPAELPLPPPPPLAGERVAWIAAGRWWWCWRPAAARRGVVLQFPDPARFPGILPQSSSKMLSCRLCDPETGECPVRYDVQSEDLPVLDDKVAAVLGCMLALLNQGRTEVLAGRIPPLALFRGDMKRCCESMQVALNACYDAGFARVDGHPCPTFFANWFPVYSTVPDVSATDELEVAFWRGGQVSEEDWDCSSAEQIQQYAALVSDGMKKPIYLHSKEGISRTSAMVSRWKQYATHAERLATKKRSPIVNGKALKNDLTVQHTSGPCSSSNGSENAHDIDIEITSDNLEVTYTLPNGQSTEQGEMHDSRTELLSDFKLETSPLKAQFPTCNRKQNLRAEHNEAIDCEAADMMVLKSANGTLFDNDYILSCSFALTIDPKTSHASNHNGNAQLGSQEPSEKNGGPYLERVQSRRKAEMFLVRTDGFSCTREKVTESSLAFTHPSTQQQMFMWRTPPKTVLLLKKLGDELMEEAKEVQGDGMIVATPTDSTAYSTAAGDSMVHLNVPCMLFTPICPYSLSFRPVILPDSARLELKIPDDARSNAWVSFDGKRRQQLSRGDSLHISMSKHLLPTVNKSDRTGNWFRSLIRCLNWNERLDEKAL
ncbi:hypothetical protein VPH35_076875 [Triticum aestivum]